jgi:hypothetical protein
MLMAYHDGEFKIKDVPMEEVRVPPCPVGESFEGGGDTRMVP